MSDSKTSWALRALRLITKDEVKTPLAFLYKVVPYVVASLLVVLYAPVQDDLKLIVIRWTFIGLFGLAVIVLGCALWRPKHIVYGETGHRAEYKIDYGTESHQLEREEVDELSAISNSDRPRLEGPTE
jgi:hypothetical protein